LQKNPTSNLAMEYNNIDNRRQTIFLFARALYSMVDFQRDSMSTNRGGRNLEYRGKAPYSIAPIRFARKQCDPFVNDFPSFLIWLWISINFQHFPSTVLELHFYKCE